MGKLIYADALIEDIKAQTALLRALGNEDITKIADLMEKGFVEEINKQPTIEERKWIPCSERLPEDLEAVNITWVNHEPESYYADIKDKPYTASAVHYRDKWYWYSAVCEDILAEYGTNYADEMDEAIEVTGWKPFPEPYEKGGCKE